MKIGLEDIPALTFAGLRFTLAFLCLLPVALLSRQLAPLRSMSKHEWGHLVTLGIFLYTLTQGSLFVALSYLPAVTANLFMSFSSVVVALMSIVWLAERPTPLQWLGVLIAALGVVLYFHPVAFPRDQLLGVVAGVVCTIANSTASVLGREVNRRGDVSPLVVTIISMGAGSILLLSAGLALQGLPKIDLQNWLIIGWLALVNTSLAFTIWNRTLRTLSATESSIIYGTILIWVPVLAVVFLHEQITPKEIVALIVVGIGTLLVQLRELPTRPKKDL